MKLKDDVRNIIIWYAMTHCLGKYYQFRIKSYNDLALSLYALALRVCYFFAQNYKFGRIRGPPVCSKLEIRKNKLKNRTGVKYENHLY